MVEHTAVNRGVVGSSPTRGVQARSKPDAIWLHGQAVKTSPFHGGNTGSIPVGVIESVIFRLSVDYRFVITKNSLRRHGQAVRQRSATPLSPVRIWLAPLKSRKH